MQPGQTQPPASQGAALTATLPEVVRAFWRERRVLVTGARGFVGGHLVPALKQLDATVSAPARAELELHDGMQVLTFFREFRPQTVIHLAAVQGGVAFINERPADILLENLTLHLHVLEACRQTGVPRVLCMGSSCAYPDQSERPLREEELWAGPMHGSVAHYGFTKKLLSVALETFARQHGMLGTVVIPATLVGPGDDFRLERAHVAGALVRRFVEAVAEGKSEVSLWGSGRPVREFMDVADGVQALLRTGALAEPVPLLNVGRGEGTSIRCLAELISRLTGFQGTLHWDVSRPEGAPGKVLDRQRCQALLGWVPDTPLETTLSRTVSWYRTQVNQGADAR